MKPQKRPYLKIRRWTWLSEDGSKTPGLALHHAGKVLAHLTPTEARAMADKLHDYADKLDQEQNS